MSALKSSVIPASNLAIKFWSRLNKSLWRTTHPSHKTSSSKANVIQIKPTQRRIRQETNGRPSRGHLNQRPATIRNIILRPESPLLIPDPAERPNPHDNSPPLHLEIHNILDVNSHADHVHRVGDRLRKPGTDSGGLVLPPLLNPEQVLCSAKV